MTDHNQHQDAAPRKPTDGVKDAASAAGEKLHNAYDATRGAVAHGYASARDKASSAYDSTRDRASRAGHATADGLHNNPLAALGAGIVVGAIVGALLPRTQRERKLFGDLGRTLKDRAGAAAAAARDAGTQKLGELGLTKDAAKDKAASLVDAAKQVAGSAGAAASQAAKSGDGKTSDNDATPPAGTGGTSVLGQSDDTTDLYSGDVAGGQDRPQG